MTAVNVIRTPEAVHFCTDGNICDPENGKVVGLIAKVFTAPHMPLILATRGIRDASRIVGSILAAECLTFDHVVDKLETSARALYAVYLRETRVSDHPSAAKLEIYVGGYSLDRRQCESYCVSIFPDHEGAAAAAQGIECFKLYAIPDGTCAPMTTEQASELDWPTFVRRMADGPLVDTDLISLMEMQRTAEPRIGGFVQLTTLSKQGIRQRVLHRWDDTIEPPATHAVH